MVPRGLAALTALTMLLAGCSFMNVKTEVTKTAADYKGKRTEPARVEVFEEGAPEAPYTEIAVIKVTGRRDVDRGDLVDAMRVRAARLGADAIMNIRFSEELKSGGAGGEMVCPFEGACYYQQTKSTIVGMASGECQAIVFSDQRE